ncbi:GIY-YIG nuclease family protein [Sphaerisporangium album]|uniref:GIY-YIG nuclease family protein n=1 Tax=Sphaerisporangium album TaxID=509200 RepID=A0A367FJZ2_9ACTN|nr:GIY-YIG nuclease family protein [Sphaerisporangium album]
MCSVPFGKLEEIGAAVSDVEAREANVRAGYVYVISNVGAFGEEVVKIGMTRRLDPEGRVRDLGNASVPFRFDTHALIRRAIGIRPSTNGSQILSKAARCPVISAGRAVRGRRKGEALELGGAGALRPAGGGDPDCAAVHHLGRGSARRRRARRGGSAGGRDGQPDIRGDGPGRVRRDPRPCRRGAGRSPGGVDRTGRAERLPGVTAGCPDRLVPQRAGTQRVLERQRRRAAGLRRARPTASRVRPVRSRRARRAPRRSVSLDGACRAG